MVCESQLPQTWQQHITAFAAPAVGGIALGAAALFAGIERRAQAGLFVVAQEAHLEAIVGARFLDLGKRIRPDQFPIDGAIERRLDRRNIARSEEHTSELPSLMR